jgi:D-xylose transport system permease protein
MTSEAAPAIAAASAPRPDRAASRISARDVSMLLALVLIGGFFAVLSPTFLSARNLSILMIEVSITATLAIGMLLVILPGHIDLSVGSGVGLVGGIAAVLVFWSRWPAGAALAVGLAVAIVLWHLIGRLIVQQNVPAFIITLGGLLAFKGFHWLVIDNGTVPVSQGGTQNLYSLLTTYYLPAAAGYAGLALVLALLVASKLAARRRRRALGLAVETSEMAVMKLFVAGQLLLLFVLLCNQYRGVPLPAVILGLVATFVHVLTRHTRFGRYLYAIGGNQEAAFVSGVPIQRVVIGAYTILGVLVALTGFMQTAYTGASTTTVGGLMELDAVAACVIGGTSLRGGRGTVLGVLFGALVMATLLNGMTLMAVSPEIKFVARGLVLVLAVWMDVRLTSSKD